MMPENEMMDIVNKDDKSIGSRTRNVIHSTGLWHRGIHIFLFNRNGELLLEKRSKEKDVCPGFYDCISEHLKLGESYEEAAKRSLEEELNIRNVKLKRLVKIRWKYWKNDNMVSEVYECNWNGPIRIERNEMDYIKFCALKKIQDMLKRGLKFTPWFVEIFKWYANKKPRFKIMS